MKFLGGRSDKGKAGKMDMSDSLHRFDQVLKHLLEIAEKGFVRFTVLQSAPNIVKDKSSG